MGRFSRVKGSHGSGKKSEAPDLEAHFSDGAWYDIVLRTADSSRNRFLVQVRSDHQPRPCARIRAARFQNLRGRRVLQPPFHPIAPRVGREHQCTCLPPL
jgi:hypothetical protein